MFDKPSSCAGCPAYNWGVGYLPPEEHENARFLLLCDGPTQADVEQEQTMSPAGWVGRKLNYLLARAGVARTFIDIAHVVRCWLPKSKGSGGSSGNRAPTARELNYCFNAHYRGWAAKRGWDKEDSLVVTVGKDGAKKLLGKKKMSLYIGTINEVEI